MFDRVADLFEADDGSGSSDGDDGIWPDESTGGPDRFSTDAEEVAERRDDLDLGFSVESLARVDEESSKHGTPLGGRDGASAAEFLSRGQLSEAVKLGAYVGEVFVRRFGGEWVFEDEWSVAVSTGEGIVTVPVFEVARQSFAGRPQFAEAAEELQAAGVSVSKNSDGSGAGVTADRSDVPDTVLVDGEDSLAAVASATAYVLSSPNAAMLERLATTLADTWPEYDLDGSPASLARLDDLVGEEIDDPASQSDAIGAYVGQVFVDAYDGAWTEVDGAGWVVKLTDDSGTSALLAMSVVLRDCLTGDATFADTFAATHDTVLEETGPT